MGFILKLFFKGLDYFINTVYLDFFEFWFEAGFYYFIQVSKAFTEFWIEVVFEAIVSSESNLWLPPGKILGN